MESPPLFDPLSMPRGAKCILIGARNVGKTELIRHILLTCKLHMVHLQTTAMDYSVQRYSDIIHDEYETEYTESAIEWAMDSGAYDAIVLDDCLFSVEPFTTPIFHRLMMQQQSSVFITMMYGMSIPAEIRTLFDYVFMFRDPIVYNQRKLFAMYCNPDIYPTCEAMGLALQRATEEPDVSGYRRIREGACLVLVKGDAPRYYAPNKTKPLIQENVATGRSASSESETP
jgi:hypothetical protein